MSSYLKTKDHFLSQEQFDLLYDATLDMLVTQPQPQELAKYYASENYISHSDGSGSFMERVYQAVKKFNLQRKVALAGSFQDKPKTLLDVGAGTGDFLLAAKNKNWAVFGVEPHEGARMRAQEKGGGLDVRARGLPQPKI